MSSTRTKSFFNPARSSLLCLCLLLCAPLSQAEMETGLVWCEQLAYDARDNLIRVTDPEGRTTDYQYDKADRLIAERSGDGAEQRYQYDVNGNRTRHINANGEVIDYQYDQANRLIGIRTFSSELAATLWYGEMPQGAPQSSIRFSYNSLGQFAGYTDAESHEQRSYTPQGLLSSITTTYTLPGIPAFSKTQQYSYNANGDGNPPKK